MFDVERNIESETGWPAVGKYVGHVIDDSWWIAHGYIPGTLEYDFAQSMEIAHDKGIEKIYEKIYCSIFH